jgi:hypothetical protein
LIDAKRTAAFLADLEVRDPVDTLLSTIATCSVAGRKTEDKDGS